MKNCPYCGRENEETAVHCHECGTEMVLLPPKQLTGNQLLVVRVLLVLAVVFVVLPAIFFAGCGIITVIGTKFAK